MNLKDLSAIVEAIAPVIRQSISEAIASFDGRMKALETRQPERGEKGEQGTPGVAGRDAKDPDVELLAAVIREEVARVTKDFPKPKDGKDADLETVRNEISREVARVVAALPVPKDGVDGKSLAPDDVRPLVESAVAIAVAALPRPANGKDADEEAIAKRVVSAVIESLPPLPKDGKEGPAGKDADPALIRAEVAQAVAQLPRPQDGKSVSVEDVRPIIESAVKALPRAVDGKSVSVDDIKPLFDAAFAAWQLEFERRAYEIVQRSVDRLPPAKDGASVRKEEILPELMAELKLAIAGIHVPKDGKDGRDGISLEDCRAEMKSDRVIAFHFKGGEKVHSTELRLKGYPIYRGIYKPGEYEEGDSVTYGGSIWIAEKDTKGTPGTANSGWRLAVKRGNDGKDGSDASALRD